MTRVAPASASISVGEMSPVKAPACLGAAILAAHLDTGRTAQGLSQTDAIRVAGGQIATSTSWRMLGRASTAAALTLRASSSEASSPFIFQFPAIMRRTAGAVIDFKIPVVPIC